MADRIASRIARIFALLFSLASAATATAQEEGPPFTTVAEAQRYLSSNPAGRWAEAAFRLIVAARLAQQFPGYPPERLLGGVVTRRAANSPLDDQDIAQAFAALSSGVVVPQTLVAPIAPRRSVPVPPRY